MCDDEKDYLYIDFGSGDPFTDSYLSGYNYKIETGDEDFIPGTFVEMAERGYSISYLCPRCNAWVDFVDGDFECKSCCK